MSGYFDALIRSSGMAIGHGSRALTPAIPAPLDVDADGHTTGTDPTAMRSASTPHEPFVPSRSPDVVQPMAPPRVRGRVEGHTQEEPQTAPPPVRGAREGAVHSPDRPAVPPAESPMPDLGPSLVRAAMRWVAAGTPQIAADSAVSPIAAIALDVPARQHSVPTAPGNVTAIAPNRRHRDDEDEKRQSLNAVSATPVPLNVPVREPEEKTVPIRASLVPTAPPAQAASPVHDEVVEVSIGAIHVRVDAPRAQTVARPAATPAASAPGAATTRPSRSALSRRALRRI